MRLTPFDMELLRYISNYGIIKLETLSDHFELSEKTLRNRLNDLEEIFQEYHIQLDHLSGGQYLIRGREHFAYLLKENSLRYEIDFDKKCLLLLALNTDYLTVQDIADKLIASKSYAEKKISQMLREYKDEIRSQRHYGIRYDAPPEQRFARIVQILFPYIVGNDFLVSLRQFDRLHLPILSYFTEKQLDKALQAVEWIRTKEEFSFTDESIQQLYLYFLLLFRFCAENSTFQFDSRFLKKLVKRGRGQTLEYLQDFCTQLSVKSIAG